MYCDAHLSLLTWSFEQLASKNICVDRMADLGNDQIEEMIDLCEKMLEKSYCVYSKFPVAAVILTECGKVVTGE